MSIESMMPSVCLSSCLVYRSISIWDPGQTLSDGQDVLLKPLLARSIGKPHYGYTMYTSGSIPRYQHYFVQA